MTTGAAHFLCCGNVSTQALASSSLGLLGFTKACCISRSPAIEPADGNEARVGQRQGSFSLDGLGCCHWLKTTRSQQGSSQLCFQSLETPTSSIPPVA